MCPKVFAGMSHLCLLSLDSASDSFSSAADCTDESTTGSEAAAEARLRGLKQRSFNFFCFSLLPEERHRGLYVSLV